MVDHAYDGLRAMCSVAFIALLWFSLEFGLFVFLRERNQNARLLFG